MSLASGFSSRTAPALTASESRPLDNLDSAIDFRKYCWLMKRSQGWFQIIIALNYRRASLRQFDAMVSTYSKFRYPVVRRFPRLADQFVSAAIVCPMGAAMENRIAVMFVGIVSSSLIGF